MIKLKTQDNIIDYYSYFFKGEIEKNSKGLPEMPKYNYIYDRIETKSEKCMKTVINPIYHSVIANIKINGCWKCMTLFGNGQIIDKIYKVFGKNSFYVTDEKRFFHTAQIQIIVEKENESDEFTVTYDIVNVDRYSGKSKIKQTHNEHIKSTNIKYNGTHFVAKLNQNFPTENLQIYAKSSIKSIHMIINDQHKLPPLNFEEIKNYEKKDDDYDGYLWKLDFGDRPINFSRIDMTEIFMEVDGVALGDIMVCGTAHNIINFNDGYARLQYVS